MRNPRDIFAMWQNACLRSREKWSSLSGRIDDRYPEPVPGFARTSILSMLRKFTLAKLLSTPGSALRARLIRGCFQDDKDTGRVIYWDEIAHYIIRVYTSHTFQIVHPLPRLSFFSPFFLSKMFRSRYGAQFHVLYEHRVICANVSSLISLILASSFAGENRLNEKVLFEWEQKRTRTRREDFSRRKILILKFGN